MSEVDDFLEHHGVKGMHWGKRKSSGGSSSSGGSGGSAGPVKKTRSELRGLNKAAKKAENDKRNASIDAARTRLATTSRSNYDAAKAQYKIDKGTIGKHEAAKAFNKVKDQNIADFALSQQAKSGKERTRALLIGAGVALVTGLASQ